MVNYADVANRPWNDYATSITEIIVEGGVTGIGNRAFRDLTNVTKISLPEGLLLIDQYALKGCTGLTELTLPSTLTTLNYQALNSCTGLTSLVVPASVKTVGNQVFSGSSKLAAVAYLSTDTTFGTGSLTFPDTTVIYCYEGSTAQTYATERSLTSRLMVATGTCGASGSESSVTWSFDASTQTLTISGTGAMADYTNAYTIDPWNDHNALIKHLVINEGVTTVGAYAFGRTTALESVSFPSTLTSIGRYAFSGCSSLDNLTIPGAVVLSDSAFRDCTSLKNLVLEEGKTSISARIFQGCTALKEVVIPASVTEIGYNVTSPFNGCTGLESITFLNPNTEILPATVSGNESTAISTNAVIKSIGDGEVKTYAEANGYTFVKIDPPPLDSGTLETGLTWELSADGVLTISGTGAMPDFTSTVEAPWIGYAAQITSAVISDGVTTIGDRAFNTTAITSIVIPDSVTTIGYNGFRNCKSLASVTIGSGVISIDTYGFNGCSALTSITVPGNVKTIANFAFNNCSKLATIILEEGVETTSNNTFNGCSALTEIVFPSTMVSIGRTDSDPTFVSCTSLEKVVFLNSNTVICVPSTGVAIPEGVTIHGYADSTAEKYATANGNPFVTMNAPFAYDCTTVFEFTANAVKAEAGTLLNLVALKRTSVTSVTSDTDLPFLAVDENGFLHLYANGKAEPLYDSESNAIVLADETTLAIVYNDKNGTARFYVNRDVPTYGDEQLAMNVPVADDDFLALVSVSDNLITADGVTVSNTFSAEDAPAEFAGFQVGTDDTRLRILAGIDMLYYDSIGFEISLYSNGSLQGTVTENVTAVFSAILADNDKVTAEELGFNYLAAVEITGIDRTDYPSDADVYFVVKTFSKIGDETLEGTERKIYVYHDGATHEYTKAKKPYTGEFVPVLRFVASSDVHITDTAVSSNGTLSGGAERLRTAIDQILAYIADEANNDGYADLNAIVLAGDIVNTGTDTQYQNAEYIFGSVADGGIMPEGAQLVITMGNHDYGNDSSLSYEEAMAFQDKFEAVFGAVTRDTVINGYHFITITCDERLDAKGDNGANMRRPYGYDYSEATIATATKLIEAAVAEDPNKPVFIIQHVPTSDTVLYSHEDYVTAEGKVGKADTSDSAVPTLFELQKKYPNLVVFAGHSHAPINDVASIHQEYFTAINTGVLGGSAAQSRVDGAKFSDSTDPNVSYSSATHDDVYLVEVDSYNRVRIRIWDATSESFVGEEWMVDSFDPYGFKYTEDRYDNDDIFFPENAVITEKAVTATSVTVEFPSVPAESLAARVYKLVATDAEGNEVVGYRVPAYYDGDRTAPIAMTLSGLDPETTYTLTVYALNPLYSNDIADKGTICSEALTVTFTTESEASIPAGGDLINLQIDATAGSITNVATDGLTATIVGTPSVSYDNTIGMDAVTVFSVTNEDETVTNNVISFNLDSVNDLLVDGMTVEAYVKLNETPTSEYVAPIGAMHNGGFGLLAQSDGIMKFGYYNGSSYQYIEFSYTVGQYYHIVAVFNGSSYVLYVDGESVGSVEMTTMTLPATTSYRKCVLGADTYLSARYTNPANCSIAKFNLYSDPMTADEVAEAYAALAQE